MIILKGPCKHIQSVLTMQTSNLYLTLFIINLQVKKHNVIYFIDFTCICLTTVSTVALIIIV